MQPEIAFVTERCTGCGGAPVCRVYCPRGALRLVEDRDHFPFKRIRVDPILCSGCGACVARGPKGSRIFGCPWDAMRMGPVSGDSRKEREGKEDLDGGDQARS